jgi:hypothetical protein
MQRKVGSYNRFSKIPGLPDTTNITDDPQLRLFLDRIKLFCENLNSKIITFERYANVDNIANDLMQNQTFNSALNNIINNGIRNINREIEYTDGDKDLQMIYVTLSKDTVNMYFETTCQARVTYYPSDTKENQRGVTWSSSDTDIATIDADGNITVHAVGECKITAVSTFNSSITGSADLKVINLVGFNPLPVYPAYILGRDYAQWGTESELVWVYTGEATATVQKNQIFTGAYPSAAEENNTIKEQYSTSRLSSGKTASWQSPPDFRNGEDALWHLYGANKDDGSSDMAGKTYYGYMLPTGNSTTLSLPADDVTWDMFGVPAAELADRSPKTWYEYQTFDGKYTTWTFKKYLQTTGWVGARKGEPHFVKDNSDIGWGEGMWMLEPSMYTDAPYPVPPYRSLYPVDVQYFKYDDGNGELYYQMVSTNTVSTKYVFEPITPEDV